MGILKRFAQRRGETSFGELSMPDYDFHAPTALPWPFPCAATILMGTLRWPWDSDGGYLA